MSFLDMDFDDVVEPRAVDPDREYKVRIIEVRDGTDKNGHPYMLPRLEILDEIGAKDLTYFLGLPHGEMDAKRLNQVKYKIKTFMDAFGLGYSSEPSSWAGEEAWAILGQEENEQYGAQNFVKKFVKA